MSDAIVLAVTGSIAAYKAAEIARLLLAEGLAVLPVMTTHAKEFLGAATLSGITGEPVRTTMWDASFPGEMHVALAKRARAIVIAPATADVLARLAQGRADDVVTALALVATVPVLVAPSMHPAMWENPATQRNVELLRATGRFVFVGPEVGPVASGDVGMGRMAEPARIVAAVKRSLTAPDLAGLRIVVTAGPTVEDLDPVRFLSNRSTGKMGFAIARRAALRGATVTLVTGPVSLATPAGVVRVDVRSALSMQTALRVAMGEALQEADVLFMSAAVSDFRPAELSASKRKKSEGTATTVLELTENPDLLAEIGALRASRGGAGPILVGFAVETGTDSQIVAYANDKLRRKGVDFVVANHASESFGRDENRVSVVSAAGAQHWPALPKDEVADRLLNEAGAKLSTAARTEAAAKE